MVARSGECILLPCDPPHGRGLRTHMHRGGDGTRDSCMPDASEELGALAFRHRIMSSPSPPCFWNQNGLIECRGGFAS